MCWEKTKNWQPHCDDSAVDYLPHQWGTDWDAAYERGDKIWCVVPQSAPDLSRCHIERYYANQGEILLPKSGWVKDDSLRIVCWP